MIRFNFFMKHDLVLNIEKLLSKRNNRLLKKLNDEQFKKFFSWYLDHEYNNNSQYPLFGFNLINIAQDIMPKVEIEEKVINSKYFATITSDRIIYFFRCYRPLRLINLDSFVLLETFFTSKIDNPLIFISLINKGKLLDYDYVWRKLIESRNIEDLIKYSNSLNNYIHRRELALKMVESGYYSLNDIEEYILNTTLNINDIVDMITVLYNIDRDPLIIDLFINIIIKDKENICYYMDEISKNNKCSSEMKNEIVKKLLDSKKYYFLCQWFLNDIECEYNYNIIDELMLENEVIVSDVIACINNKYLEYVLTKLLNRNIDFISSFVEFICRDYDKLIRKFDIQRIDKILDFIYYRYYDFNIFKESALNLIKLGSKYIPKFMSEYDFTEDERKGIYEVYKSEDSDFERVYGLYLVSGDRKYLLNEEDAKKKFTELVTRREKVRERRK